MKNYSKYGKGWYNESDRHRLARLGIKTGRKVATLGYGMSKINYAKEEMIQSVEQPILDTTPSGKEYRTPGYYVHLKKVNGKFIVEWGDERAGLGEKEYDDSSDAMQEFDRKRDEYDIRSKVEKFKVNYAYVPADLPGIVTTGLGTAGASAVGWIPAIVAVGATKHIVKQVKSMTKKKKRKTNYAKEEIRTLVQTSDGKIQTVERLMSKGTPKQKEEFEAGEGIIFEAIVRGKKYKSYRYPKFHIGALSYAKQLKINVNIKKSVYLKDEGDFISIRQDKRGEIGYISPKEVPKFKKWLKSSKIKFESEV